MGFLTAIYAVLMAISFFMWLLAPKSDLTKRIIAMKVFSVILVLLVVVLGLASESAEWAIGLVIPASLILGWLVGVKIMNALNKEGKRFTYLIIIAGAGIVEQIVIRSVLG